jgi:hypothetical protein
MPLDAGNGITNVLGPILAVVVVILLAVLSKWIFGNGRNRTAASRLPPAGPADHGLLTPVADLPDRAAGARLRAALSEAGIRSTLGVRRDGSVQVLVFPADEDRARKVVPPG